VRHSHDQLPIVRLYRYPTVVLLTERSRFDNKADVRVDACKFPWRVVAQAPCVHDLYRRWQASLVHDRKMQIVAVLLDIKIKRVSTENSR